MILQASSGVMRRFRKAGSPEANRPYINSRDGMLNIAPLPAIPLLLGVLIRFLKSVRRRMLLSATWFWRRCMYRTTFIAVTGSVGKSTCTELIGAVLESRFTTVRTSGNRNFVRGVARTVLSIRPWHKYAVVEVGLDGPGQMESFARALRPDVVVWISVARTHTMNFRTLEVTAREKAKLVEGLRQGGLAVLNDDNSHIRAFDAPSSVRTIYYGSTERSVCSASAISSNWPARLSFRAVVDGEEIGITTKFVGEHWVPGILPALVIGRMAGISLEDAAHAIAECEPLPMRMSPVLLPNGATLFRDERNGSIDSLAPAMKALADATATRKMIVFTDVSDSPRNPRKRLRDVGRAAAEAADAAIFLGDHCEYAARAAIAAGMRSDQVWAYYNIEQAALRLKSELRSGDLVLLRGRKVDHMARLYLSLIQPVTCWKDRCRKRIDCEYCKELK